ncbi:serine protease gd-like [Macrosteles quadrilineatus]|uniref:serine protease gd-like n=1 Tax=Macrosteles quadrilineatus TaxID=74068 RepID=UPI0023E11BCF|nr:serine protease gd-like [Macrosteles quadrilineatus]
MYRVRFPLFKPLPTVRLIKVNSQSICSGPMVSGPVVTDIRLEHSLWPLGLNNATEHITFPQENITPTPYNLEPNEQCGQAIEPNPLVVGGRSLRHGEWPWLVAIFVLNSLGLEFHCSGTIITKKFVLTVGHCMRHEEAGTMDPVDVVVYLGKYNLQQWEESHSVIKEVVEIHIHPDFDSNKYTADIALLQLKTPVTYNMFIQPVCLWSQPPDLELIVGHIGTVVGWGRDGKGNKMSPIPRVMEIPIVSTEECVQSHNEFVFLTSSSTLCAGAKDGRGPCNGDSGGGLMLPVKWKSTTRWELRGIVSLSLLNTTTQSCDLTQYVVFTDTAKFLSWIYSIVNKTP